MMRYPLPVKAGLACLMILALTMAPMFSGTASAISLRPISPYAVNPLVSDLPGFATFLDPFLVNPWGMVFLHGGEVLVADNGTGVATLYTREGIPFDLIITIPPRPGTAGPSLPTGAVLNTTSEFAVHQGGFASPALAIFASEQGVLTGWAPDLNLTQAIVGAVGSYLPGEAPRYTGLAMAIDSSGDPLLYAADSNHDRVDVYDGDWTLVGSFTDPTAHLPFTPFGIANLGNRLWVTFAPPESDMGASFLGGEGFVDIFSADGAFLRRFASGGRLDFPWGVTAAPKGFVPSTNVVLIGNFGDGRINVFDAVTGNFAGQLGDEFGLPIELPGLWAIGFPSRPHFNGIPRFTDFHPPTMFFTAGIFGEEDGLFGTIRPLSPFPVLGSSRSRLR